MSELDKRLASDVSETIWDYCHAEDTEHGIPKVTGQDKATEIIVARVKQAFIDDGWTQDLARKHFNDAYLDGIKQSAGLMTREEWEKQAKAEPIELSKDKSWELCVVCNKPVSDDHVHASDNMTGQEFYDRFKIRISDEVV